MITGGGAMHLNDSVGKVKSIKYHCNHHEQACAIAAEGYARTSGKLGVVVVTTGPGGTNTLTGVIGQWLDSVPVLYISGQVKHETSVASCREINLRQLGDQEINIVDIVAPVTKFAKMLTNPNDVKRYLDEAIYEATNGRPGPVWLDIPLNIQGSLIEEKDLKDFTPSKSDQVKNDNLKGSVKQYISMLKNAKRPVIVAGHGVRISGAQKIFLDLVNKMGVPILSTFNAPDLVPSDNKYLMGRIGTLGNRSANLVLQNSDLVLTIGSRNNIRQISYNWKFFAREAKKVVVDIDCQELKKPTIKPDLSICADAKEFIQELLNQTRKEKLSSCKEWVKWCRERKRRFPFVDLAAAKEKKYVNPYHFVSLLTKAMGRNEVLVAGNGTACVAAFQAGDVKPGQRMFWNSGCASMGYDLPAAIGACIANGNKKTVCLAGDGSMQMNIQELQTVSGNKLPIKIFYLNNNGYVSIRQTQDSFFDGRHVGCDNKSGVTFPDICKVGKAYGFKTIRITNQSGLQKKIQKVLKDNAPWICEITINPDFKFNPKLSSRQLPGGKMVSSPLEDMWPFLDREELKNNMIIPIIEEE